jgi:outer membrane biosynthesis protein TonB
LLSLLALITLLALSTNASITPSSEDFVTHMEPEISRAYLSLPPPSTGLFSTGASSSLSSLPELGADFFGSSDLLPTFESETDFEASVAPESPDFGVLSPEDADSQRRFSQSFADAVLDLDGGTHFNSSPQDPEEEGSDGSNLFEDTQVLAESADVTDAWHETQQIYTQEPLFFSTQELEPATQDEEESQEVTTQQETQVLEQATMQDLEEPEQHEEEKGAEQQKEEKGAEQQEVNEELELQAEEGVEEQQEKGEMEQSEMRRQDTSPDPSSEFGGCSPRTRSRRLDTLRRQLVTIKEAKVRSLLYPSLSACSLLSLPARSLLALPPHPSSSLMCSGCAQWRRGDLVWAKLPNYFWWPAQVRTWLCARTLGYHTIISHGYHTIDPHLLFRFTCA